MNAKEQTLKAELTHAIQAAEIYFGETIDLDVLKNENRKGRPNPALLTQRDFIAAVIDRRKRLTRADWQQRLGYTESRNVAEPISRANTRIGKEIIQAAALFGTPWPDDEHLQNYPLRLGGPVWSYREVLQ